jgi:periplasmic divalent cation tolerance protein
MTHDLSVVYITAPSVEEARTLAKELVEAKLAACVNYWQNIASVYRWQGALCEEQEVIMLVKTTKAAFDHLQVFIQERHRYTTPCIIQLEVSGVTRAFGQWVAEEVDNPVS